LEKRERLGENMVWNDVVRRGKFASVAILIGLNSVSCDRSAASVPVDFVALEHELEAKAPNAPTLVEFSRSPMFVQLLNRDDPLLFNRMAKQSAMPCVSAAGVIALQQRYPNEAFRAAIWSLAHASSPEDLRWGYMVAIIQAESFSVKGTLISDLESLCSNRFDRRTGLVMLAQSLPASFLEAWVQSDVQSRLRENESIIVGRLCSDHDVTDAELRQGLIKILGDLAVEEWQIRAIARKHRKFIALHIQLDKLDAPNNRIELVKKLINLE
jgi:hypothetical protein